MMLLDKLLHNVSVVGAAGKMGRGISLLLLQQMAKEEAAGSGAVGRGDYQLHLIDADAQGLDKLRHFLKMHLTKYAEGNINLLRRYFSQDELLVSNADMIK